MATSTRFSQSKIERAKTNVVFGGKKVIPCSHFCTRFCKNVVESKQIKNMVVVLPFFDLENGSVTSNKNN